MSGYLGPAASAVGWESTGHHAKLEPGSLPLGPIQRAPEEHSLGYLRAKIEVLRADCGDCPSRRLRVCLSFLWEAGLTLRGLR